NAERMTLFRFRVPRSAFRVGLVGATHSGQVNSTHASAAQRREDLIRAKHQSLPDTFEKLRGLKMGEVFFSHQMVRQSTRIAPGWRRGRPDQGIELAPLKQAAAGQRLTEAIDR